MYFHHLIFQSIPTSLTNNEETHEECFQARGLVKDPARSPFPLYWLLANSSTLKHESST